MDNKPVKKAGIDFGLTNIKIYFQDGAGNDIFHSSADLQRDALALTLKHFGVTDLCVAGNGPTDGFEGFRQHRVDGHPLIAELVTQAKGAQCLLQQQKFPIPPSHYLVSIGTGTSYMTCDDAGNYLPLLGSAIGAGTVDGLLALRWGRGLHIDELVYSKLIEKANLSSFDLMLVDVIPAVKGTPLEHYAASHLAQVPTHGIGISAREHAERLCLSAINMLVTDVVRSLLLHDKNPQCRHFLDLVWMSIIDVVILGTMPHRSKSVRMLLEQALRSIGKNPIFPEHGEYALAVGAYNIISI